MQSKITPSHSDLVKIGVKFVRKLGFPVVASELRSLGSREQADVIGFRHSCSILVEAKCSRSDFLADAKKPERKEGGLGVYRFFICPVGLINEIDLPTGWGLLWVDHGKVTIVKGPTGNIWPAYDPSCPHGNWAQFMHKSDLSAERSVLFSISRRLSKPQK